MEMFFLWFLAIKTPLILIVSCSYTAFLFALIFSPPQGSAAFVLPVSECVFPGGELHLCPVGARRSDALRVAEVNAVNRPIGVFTVIPRVALSTYLCAPTVSSDGGVRHAVLARVLINDSLFVLCAVSLAVCIFKIAKMSSANVYLESKVRENTTHASLGALTTFYRSPDSGRTEASVTMTN